MTWHALDIPWRPSRHTLRVQFGKASGLNAVTTVDDPSIYRLRPTGDDTLRIDLGSGTCRHFVIGFSKADGSFIECLRVELADTLSTGDKTPLVSIGGDLKVAGKVTGEFVDRAFSAEAMAAIFGSFQAGFVAGNSGQ